MNLLTKVLVALPNHWAARGTETLWARRVDVDLFALEKRDVLGFETCEARVRGSFDDIEDTSSLRAR